MKKLFYSLLTISMLLGCSKDEDKPKASMSAQINSVAWSAVTRVTVLTNQKFVITGTSLDGKSISITVSGATAGTYILGTGSIQCEAVYKKSLTATTEDTYAAITGRVVLTEVNTSAKEISGTFEFAVWNASLGTSSISISGGSFENLKYTETTE